MTVYDSPLFVDVVLYIIYGLLLLAVVLTVWSVVRSIRLQGRGNSLPNRVPQRRIVLATALFLVLTMGVGWLTGTTEPLTVNGKVYDSAFWLRISDMFIFTAVLLVVAIALLAAFAEIRRRRYV
jgi:hypothetical protein